MVACTSVARLELPRRASAIASLTAAISAEEVDVVVAAAKGAAGGRGTGLALVVLGLSALVLADVVGVIDARRGPPATAGRGRGSGTFPGAAASACGPNPARPATASAARIPIWA